jgi:hypothetical protein
MVDALDLLVWAEFSADVRGCTCQPEISIRETSPGVYRAVIAHDDECAALDGGAA